MGRLGTISARLGPSWRHFGLSRRADQRRQSSFGKIRTPLTREHHFVVALKQFWDHLGVILGASWATSGPSCGHIGHLGVILGLSCAISVLRLRKTDDAWSLLWSLRAILAPFWRHLEATLGPSWGHPGATFGRFGPLGERTDDGIANLAKFALRLHESTILGSP